MDLERAELLITSKSTILETYELSLVTETHISKNLITKARKAIAKTEKEIEKFRKKHDK